MKRAFATSLIVLSLLATSAIAAGAATAPPPGVVTGVANSVQPTSVVVHATVNPHGLATSWFFQYGPSASGFTARTSSNSAGAGHGDVNVSSTLSGLSPSTSYSYRIVAVSSAGTSYGGTGVFNTSVAPSALTSAASSVTATSATLNGTVTPEGLKTTWYFEYGATTAYGAKTAKQVVAPGPNPVAVTAPITGLVAHSTYHFRLVALSSAGTTTGSDEQFTTDLAVTLNASTSTVTFGGFVTLSGTLASGAADQQVTLQEQLYNQSAMQTFATVTTGANGSWSYTAQPAVRTTYQAAVSNGSSSQVVISVRPVVSLSKKGQNLVTKVTANYSFAGHVLQLQRLISHTWVTWKHVKLNNRATATFATSLPKGRTAIRMAIGPFVEGIDQAGPGYLAGFSEPMVYVNR